MSKIIVDELPKCADDCPFTSNLVCVRGDRRMDCCSLKCSDHTPCALEEGYECDWLMEMPKGKQKEEVDSEVEMIVEHNDGTVEYVKDIDNILLLADKNYQIAYTGKF